MILKNRKKKFNVLSTSYRLIGSPREPIYISVLYGSQGLRHLHLFFESLFIISFFETLFLYLCGSEWKDSVKSQCCVCLTSSLPTCSPDVCGWLLTWVSFQCFLEPHGRIQVYNKLFHMIWTVQSGRTSGLCRAAFRFDTEGLSHRGCNTEGMVKSGVCSMLSFGDAFLTHIWAWAWPGSWLRGRGNPNTDPLVWGRQSSAVEGT